MSERLSVKYDIIMRRLRRKYDYIRYLSAYSELLCYTFLLRLAMQNHDIFQLISELFMCLSEVNRVQDFEHTNESPLFLHSLFESESTKKWSLSRPLRRMRLTICTPEEEDNNDDKKKTDVV